MNRRLPLALFLCALPLIAGVACGDDDDEAAPSGGQTVASGATVGVSGPIVDTKPSPKLDGPASKYSILLQDVGTSSYLTDIPSTYVLDRAGYASSRAFDSPTDGAAKLQTWGYKDGYETAMVPEGRDAAVLNGAYHIFVETHLFDSEEGAKKAFQYFKARISQNPGVQAVSAGPVGNESAAFKASAKDKISTSNQNRVIHQVVFRRGNLVALVLTIGSEALMRVDSARNAAIIVDNKALSGEPLITPTPVSRIISTATAAATPTK